MCFPMRQIKKIIALLEIVVISYAHISKNMCKDALSSRGCLDKSDLVHQVAPEFLWPFMATYSLGISRFFVDPL